MNKFLVQGSRSLDGAIQNAGSKNIALKLMAASLLAEGYTSLSNVPDIADVPIMVELKEAMGLEGNPTGHRIDK